MDILHSIYFNLVYYFFTGIDHLEQARKKSAKDKFRAGTKVFKRILQTDGYTCGSRCTQMVLHHFGHVLPHVEVKKALKTAPEHGTHETDIKRVLRTYKLKVEQDNGMSWGELRTALEGGKVLIVDYNGRHYAIVHGLSDKHVYVADSSRREYNPRMLSHSAFKKHWSRWALIVSRA